MGRVLARGVGPDQGGELTVAGVVEHVGRREQHLLAVAGVVFKLFFTGRFRLLSTLIYIAMGWLVIVAIKPLLVSVDAFSLGWLLAGGLFYTLGTWFYQRDSIRYFHAIWHLFVLAGSVCHFVAVTAQVL